MKRIIIPLAFLLAGCGGSADGTELGGVARWYGGSPGPAVEAANEHCQKNGRTAQVTGMFPQQGYVTFSCEKVR